jgi:hypothetical protein
MTILLEKGNLKNGLIKLIEEETTIKELNEVAKNYYVILETKDYIKYLASFTNDKEEAKNYFYEVL